MSISLRGTLRAAFRGIWTLIKIVVFLIVVVVVTCRVLGAMRERWPHDQAAPSTGRFVSGGDVKIFLQEAGPSKGTPIVLVHGTGAWSEIWRETMTALARAGFHVIAIDVPPFGFSGKPSGPPEYSPEKQAKRIAAALDALSLRKVVFVGHSVGARPTVETALRAPA